jgi:glycosyltransferase involved in cell wall biosynthesis
LPEEQTSVTPLISILIPAYNAEEWIADTIRSAVAQTWPRKEIIVVDDGSADQTLAVARQFESEGVRVVAQENQGAAAARNAALALSTGDYIQWLDADDLLAPDKIAQQMRAAEQCRSTRTLLSSAWGRFMYRQHRAVFVPTPLWSDLSPSEWLMRKMEHNVYMQTATWLVSRKLSAAAGPWNTAMLGDDDGEYFCRVLLASDGVKFVPEAKVFYRASGASSLSYVGRSSRKMEAQWRSMNLHMSYLLSLSDAPRARAACVRYMQNWMVHFYPERPDIFAEAAQKARDVGGDLNMPRLPRKYSWIAALFGWGAAKRALLALPRMRRAAERTWDRSVFRLQRQWHRLTFAAGA